MHTDQKLLSFAGVLCSGEILRTLGYYKGDSMLWEMAISIVIVIMSKKIDCRVQIWNEIYIYSTCN